MGIFLGDWNCLKDVCSDFQIDAKDLEKEGVYVLLGIYEYEDYSGSAFVLFLKDDKLYEVNGGHCSCYGLEEQWEPEETSVAALVHRYEKGNLGHWYREKEFNHAWNGVMNMMPVLLPDEE